MIDPNRNHKQKRNFQRMAYTKTDIERRYTAAPMQLRKDGEEKQPVIYGHAAKFNDSTLLYQWTDEEWYEEIAPGAFDNVLEDDVRCLKNHDSNLVLGRNKAGTCTLRTDETGLYYECSPDMRISYAADTVHSVERGDISQCSFAFTIEKQSWEEEEIEGKTIVLRKIEKVKRLYDVGPVTYPAYENTNAGVKSAAGLDEYRNELKAWRESREAKPEAEKRTEQSQTKPEKEQTKKINVDQRRRDLRIKELENA